MPKQIFTLSDPWYEHISAKGRPLIHLRQNGETAGPVDPKDDVSHLLLDAFESVRIPLLSSGLQKTYHEPLRRGIVRRVDRLTDLAGYKSAERRIDLHAFRDKPDRYTCSIKLFKEHSEIPFSFANAIEWIPSQDRTHMLDMISVSLRSYLDMPLKPYEIPILKPKAQLSL